MDDAEASQRKWSEECFAKLLRTPQAGTLGRIPLVVLTRAEGGFREGSDIPAAQFGTRNEERDRPRWLCFLKKEDR
jgi:hypothetical protein